LAYLLRVFVPSWPLTRLIILMPLKAAEDQNAWGQITSNRARTKLPDQPATTINAELAEPAETTGFRFSVQVGALLSR
jgi:hypothetical protein